MKYKIVTLCGSTRFKEQFLEMQEKLTLDGYVVISVGLFGHADNKYDNIITEDVKVMLDDIHKQKIDMADEVFVINVGGYIGNSTKNEIEHAKEKGKVIRYYEGMDNKKY